MQGINDLELRKLRSEKPTLSSELVQRFAAALVEFAQSLRFAMLQGFKPASFFDGGRIGVPDLEEATFRQLVETGAYRICTLEAMGPARLQRLTELLENLVQGEDALTSSEFLNAEYVVPPQLVQSETNGGCLPPPLPAAQPPRRLLNITEAERLLTAAFDKLRRQPCFEQLRPVLLGEYWGAGRVRDPFLESITFGQLLDMKLSNLLEKRMFTDQKTAAIVAAIDDALKACGGASDRASSEPVSGASGRPEVTLRRAPWRGPGLPLSVVHSAAALALEYQWNRVSGGREPIEQVLTLLPEVLTQTEFVLQWLAVSADLAEIARLTGIDPALVEEQLLAARRSTVGLIQKTAPAFYQHWRSALAGPGVGAAELCEPYRSPRLDQGFQSVLFSLLLKALGAIPVSFGERQLAAYWTCNPGALPAMLEQVLLRLPLADPDWRQELERLFPLIEQAALLDLLAERVELDAESGSWRVRKK